MSELSSSRNPQVLVNGKQQDQQQDEEEQISAVALDDECVEDSASADKETPTKMQTVFQQVRNQIRSQVGVKAPKSSILELVQRVKDRQTEVAQENGEPENNSEEKTQVENTTDEIKDEVNLKEEELCATFEKKLEASKKALKDEFEEQISQVRKDMKAYTDHALRDLECKMQSWQSLHLQQAHPKEQQESKGPDKKQKPSAAPSLASRRGRVLTRTMTTIIPKTCTPVIIGPRAKSETLSSSKGESSRLLPREPVLSMLSKPYQSRKPLPPACPPLHQRKKPVGAKANTGN
ncbi:hypothetical protein EXN66_Car011698 [Scomber scombrus]|uniref:Uncharacterized protein n=1 Tax=Scomber scombrus TaxID=13677 RepID=A0AAV1MU01_SCOSC